MQLKDLKKATKVESMNAIKSNIFMTYIEKTEALGIHGKSEKNLSIQ